MEGMMSKKSDGLERERSARKKAEIDAEVNNNREIVYNYVAARKDVLGMTCVTELGMFEKGKRYLEWLSLNGYLVRMKRIVDSKRQYVYNAAKPYVKPVSDLPVVIPTNNEKLVQSVTRVINLLDREQIPATKSERRARTTKVGIGSSMALFGNF
jgi:hypothetical protein